MLELPRHGVHVSGLYGVGLQGYSILLSGPTPLPPRAPGLCLGVLYPLFVWSCIFWIRSSSVLEKLCSRVSPPTLSFYGHYAPCNGLFFSARCSHWEWDFYKIIPLPFNYRTPVFFAGKAMFFLKAVRLSFGGCLGPHNFLPCVPRRNFVRDPSGVLSLSRRVDAPGCWGGKGRPFLSVKSEMISFFLPIPVLILFLTRLENLRVFSSLLPWNGGWFYDHPFFLVFESDLRQLFFCRPVFAGVLFFSLLNSPLGMKVGV